MRAKNAKIAVRGALIRYLTTLVGWAADFYHALITKRSRNMIYCGARSTVYFGLWLDTHYSVKLNMIIFHLIRIKPPKFDKFKADDLLISIT